MHRSVVQFDVRREKERDQCNAPEMAGLLDGNGEPLSNEEKSYQKSIRDKLKSAADWDFRDSKGFSIR